MADFENKNNAQWNENGVAQNADNTTNNSGAANTAAPAEMPVPVSTVQQIRMHIRTVTTATPHRIRTGSAQRCIPAAERCRLCL